MEVPPLLRGKACYIGRRQGLDAVAGITSLAGIAQIGCACSFSLVPAQLAQLGLNAHD